MVRAWSLGLLLLALVAGCDDLEKRPARGVARRPVAGTVALYGPQQSSPLAPYPSDQYLVPDASSPTGRRVVIDASSASDPLLTTYPDLVKQLSGSDGFSTVGGVAVTFSGDIDPAILDLGVDAFTRDDAPLMLINVDSASPGRGERLPLVVKYYPSRAADGDVRDDFTLVAQPARPLRPRTTYLLVVTSRLKDAKGSPVGATEAMAAVLDGLDTSNYAATVREALPLVKEATGLGTEEIALATRFTTASVVEETFAMAKALRKTAPAALDGELTVVAQQGGRVRFQGRYKAPEYRKAKPDGKWQIEGGAPVPQGEASLEFLLSFSDGAYSGPRPVVIYGHGLGGDKEGVWGTSERLAGAAEHGVAVIGIDAPEHGSRGVPNADLADSVFEFFALDDKSGSFDLQRARDNFRQMAADQLQLVRLIQQLATLDVLPVGAPDGVPDLDPSQILYIGHSFGSVLASTVLAVAPEIQAACLNVGGNGLMTILRESATFQLLVKGLRPPGLTDGDLARFFAASQAIIDPGDPINFAPYVARAAGPGVEGWRPRHLLLQEVHKDSIVPNLSTELLARALGLAHGGRVVRDVGGMPLLPAPLSGNLEGGVTGAYVQFDRMDGKAAEHGGLIFAAEARAQYVRFFRDVVDGKSVTVIDPYAN
jgi:pimeloyl-ACP methyl ester carboxylesterase